MSLNSLDSAIHAISLPGAMIGYREISPGDENALMPDEAIAFDASVLKVRRASGAARIVARQLLARIGIIGRALPKGEGGAPVWPPGVVGSMSHNSRIAVATVALSRDFSALGIDIEPGEPLQPDLLGLVATAREREQIAEDPFGGRLLFAAKEAIYKAVYPLDRIFLDHHDVEVNLFSRRGVVRNGRTIQLVYSAGEHLIVVAFIPATETSEYKS